MMRSPLNLLMRAVVFIIIGCSISPAYGMLETFKKQDEKASTLLKRNKQTIPDNEYVIKKIEVSGNKHVKLAHILQAVPYKVGDKFDASKSATLINNLYAIGHFSQVTLSAEEGSGKTIHLFVEVEEKTLLEGIEISGNKSLKTSKIKEKLKLDKLMTIDEEILQGIASGIKKMYEEDNRHFVQVSCHIEPNKETTEKAVAHFKVHEGETTKVKIVEFSGAKKVSDRKLRRVIFTREDWLLGFADEAGTLNLNHLEMDKHRIEYCYRDLGYLMVKVPKAEVVYTDDKKEAKVIFHIQEGDLFTVRSLAVQGNDLFSTKEIEACIALEEGEPFSQTNLVKTINNLKDMWGEKGYIYADVDPQISQDETTKEVDVTFHVEKGRQLNVNRILISGNKVTRDNVIRRQLDIVEGDLVTTKKLQRSKSAVEFLSFFERDGVNWKVHRVSDTLSDLEMNVVEAKTGSANFQMTYGSDRYSPKPSLKAALAFEKRNLFGRGWDIGASVQASRHRLQKIETHFFDPHLLDTNVSFGAFLYSRWLEYEQWKSLERTPIQVTTGGNVKFGFGLPIIDKRLQLVLDLGIEDIHNKHIDLENLKASEDYIPVLRRTFQQGTMSWIGLDLVKDTRNHQVYPNEGYRFNVSTKTALPGFNHQFGFLRAEAEFSCYNALIGLDSLVLMVHFKMGHVESIGKGLIIPYKELFHMGGQGTVRGHTWGGIGPCWDNGDPLGAKNAVQTNIELIFPLMADYSMKGHFFYDNGAGWDTPRHDFQNLEHIKRNGFDLRHTAGFGINLMKPMPVKVDWGFKLDRRKKDGESAHEFHLNMNYAW